jgi:(1->4)-alpha-D-glucan 1-alpha-D-glucosylmutase
MAKGVEDTAFYRYVRLLALNDVGGDPGRFGITVERFHEANLERRRRFPENLLITQTHDTKRSGDVRARIGALAGMAPEWGEHVRRWFALNAPLREGSGAPDATEEYFLYQTLVGAWPISAGRLDAYLEKALREAKRNTTWVEQDHAWEQAVQGFARRVVEHEPFLADFLPFAERVAEAGHRAAIGQLLLKLTVPGVPDIYQGDELVDLSLVDPDNRRPVDWDLRRTLLTNIKGSDPLNSLGSSRGLTPGGVGGGLGPVEARGAEKLALVVRALRLRRERENAFSGAYEPLDAGPDVCAFVRGGDVLAVAVMRDAGLDAEVRLPGRWRDVLGDGATYDTGAGAPVRALTGGRSYGLLAAV